LDEKKLIGIEEKITNIIMINVIPLYFQKLHFYIWKVNISSKFKFLKGAILHITLKIKALKKVHLFVWVFKSYSITEIIAEMKRQQHSISFDSEISHGKPADDLEFLLFEAHFLEKMDEL